MHELKEKEARDERMRKVLEQQERRLQRKRELELQNLVSKKRGTEDKYQRGAVLPEIALKKAQLDEQRAAHVRSYQEIQKQRDAYRLAMMNAEEVRRGGTREPQIRSSTEAPTGINLSKSREKKQKTRSNSAFPVNLD